ncbi:hypothetical protein WAI453_011907 [Rhynchosporium graminicola]
MYARNKSNLVLQFRVTLTPSTHTLDLNSIFELDYQLCTARYTVEGSNTHLYDCSSANPRIHEHGVINLKGRGHILPKVLLQTE